MNKRRIETLTLKPFTFAIMRVTEIYDFPINGSKDRVVSIKRHLENVSQPNYFLIPDKTSKTTLGILATPSNIGLDDATKTGYNIESKIVSIGENRYNSFTLKDVKMGALFNDPVNDAFFMSTVENISQDSEYNKFYLKTVHKPHLIFIKNQDKDSHFGWAQSLENFINTYSPETN